MSQFGVKSFFLSQVWGEVCPRVTKLAVAGVRAEFTLASADTVVTLIDVLHDGHLRDYDILLRLERKDSAGQDVW